MQRFIDDTNKRVCDIRTPQLKQTWWVLRANAFAKTDAS